MSDETQTKTVIITGAAGGIGAAAARALAAEGARLMLVDLQAGPLQALADELGGALMFAADVTSEAQMAQMAQMALAEWGRIDALVAAAGILRVGGTLKPMADTSFDEFRKVIDVNLTGTFLSNRAVLGAMMKQKRGDILNISSVSGKQGRAFDAPYAASKFAIIGLSESLAEEVQRDGVRVQCLLPDAVDTQIWDQSGPAALKPRAMLAPEQVGAFIAYLLALPRDAYMVNPVVAPVPLRRRKTKA